MCIHIIALTTKIVRESLDGCSPNLWVKEAGVISLISRGTIYPLLCNIAETVLYTRNSLDASGVRPPLKVGADVSPPVSISASSATILNLLCLLDNVQDKEL